MLLSCLFFSPETKRCFFEKNILFLKPKTNPNPTVVVQRVVGQPPTCSYSCHQHGRHCCYQPETRKPKIKAEVSKWCRQSVKLFTRKFMIQRKNGKPSSDSHAITTKNAARPGRPASGLSGPHRAGPKCLSPARKAAAGPAHSGFTLIFEVFVVFRWF